MALILGNWENPPLPSDIKPPLAVEKENRLSGWSQKVVLNLLKKIVDSEFEIGETMYLMNRNLHHKKGFSNLKGFLRSNC